MLIETDDAGSGDVVAAGCVHHNDPARSSCRDVDVVDSDPCAPDDAQLGCGRDHLCSDLRATADDQRLDVSDRREQFMALQARRIDHGEAGGVLQNLEALGVEGVRNQDFGLIIFLRLK